MARKQFDPFDDRIARDIRNSLSSAFAEAIREDSPEIFRTRALEWLEKIDSEIHADYIEERLRAYGSAFSEIESANEKDPLFSAIILWNHELFFEFHECLEAVWMESQGPLRNALKGLIQAAGFYIHMRRGRRNAALRLGERAAGHISDNRAAISRIANLDALIRSLKTGDPKPFRLDMEDSHGVSGKKGLP